ncbi:MAG: hypothetical protein KDC92_08930, partial [Bacteroidetes bacterium]|nr:hypothetical protein [Bacteroidota bacterium]
KVFDEIGAFEPAFFYGMEEYDFAYRAMDKGYKIWFTKHVMVLHKVSPAGREPNVVKFSRMLQNKSLIAYRYLPWKYVLTHLFMWSGFFLTKSKWKFGKWLKALAGYNQMVKNDKRTPISKETLAYIKSVKGRLTH